MPTVKDCLEHAKWLVDKGRGEEPCVLYMAKVEAQKRKVNKEQRKRVVFVTDPETYKDWHSARDFWIEHSAGNPTIAYQNMCKVLAAVSAETIERMAEDQQE